MRATTIPFASRAAQVLRDFLAAWRSEIVSLLPRAAFGRSASQQDEIVLDVGSAGAFSICVPATRAGAGRDSRATHLFDSARPAAAARGLSRDARVRLRPDQILRRTVELPNARARILRKAVLFELDRICPLDSARVIYDMRLVGRDRVTQRARIELRLIRHDLVDQLIDHCKLLGVKIAALEISTDHRAWSGFPVNRSAAARQFARRWSTIFLFGLAVLLSGAVVTGEYIRGAAAEARIRAEIDAERGRVRAMRPLNTQIDSMRREIAFFTRERNARLLSVVLTNLSGLLPDNSWATDVDVSTETVRIQGFSTAASSLIGIFDKSENFTDAKFRSPLTRTPGGNAERFDLSVDLAVPL